VLPEFFIYTKSNGHATTTIITSTLQPRPPPRQQLPRRHAPPATGHASPRPANAGTDSVLNPHAAQQPERQARVIAESSP